MWSMVACSTRAVLVMTRRRRRSKRVHLGTAQLLDDDKDPLLLEFFQDPIDASSNSIKGMTKALKLALQEIPVESCV
jgi:hypothetical protein